MPPKQKIGPLTSLRFFAAFSVVLGHTFTDSFSPIHFTFFANFLKISFLSVNFFFTLSGYILAYVYLRSAAEVQTGKFLLSRFARIYPLYILALVVDLPWVLTAHLKSELPRVALAKTGTIFAANALMLQGYVARFRELDGPAWSLATETVFYLLFPLIAVLLWRMRPAKGFALGAAFMAGTMALIAVLGRSGINQGTITYTPIFHIHEFIIGIVLAKWHLSRLDHAETREWLRRWSPALFATAIALFATATFFYAQLPYLMMKDGLMTPVAAMLIVSASSGNQWIDRTFSMSWLVILGEASYSLYLIHIPIWHIFALLHIAIHPLSYACYLAVALAASLCSFFLFEIPARKWILSLAHTRSKESILASAVAQ